MLTDTEKEISAPLTCPTYDVNDPTTNYIVGMAQLGVHKMNTGRIVWETKAA